MVFKTSSDKMGNTFFSTIAVLLTSMVFLSGCKEQKSPEYDFDHIVLFVSDTSTRQLLNGVLTRAEQLRTVHTSQGIEGEYYLFLNGFLELLYLQDSAKVLTNEKRFRSEYSKRWLPDKSVGIGFGLKMKPFDTSLIEFGYETYVSLDGRDGDYYVMSNGNKQEKEPLVFLSMPHQEQKVFDSFEEVREKVKPEIREDVLRYLSHPIGIKKISSIELEVPEEQLLGENIEILKQLEKVVISKASEFRVSMVFDDNKHGRLIDINKSLWIKY